MQSWWDWQCCSLGKVCEMLRAVHAHRRSLVVVMISEFQAEGFFSQMHGNHSGKEKKSPSAFWTSCNSSPPPPTTHNCPWASAFQRINACWSWHIYCGNQQVPAQAKLSEGLLHLIVSFFHPSVWLMRAQTSFPFIWSASGLSQPFLLVVLSWEKMLRVALSNTNLKALKKGLLFGDPCSRTN